VVAQGTLLQVLCYTIRDSAVKGTSFEKDGGTAITIEGDNSGHTHQLMGIGDEFNHLAS
jgi:hypothetical protein